MNDLNRGLESVLAGANLTNEESSRDFWSKSLGNAAAQQRAYIEYRSMASLDERVIFYETMSGDRMNDNPLAIFEYLRSHPEYGEYLHVWSLRRQQEVPPQYQGLDDVVFVTRGTAAYGYFLATAGNVICNANLPRYFARRGAQRYLNTWHGIPYKSLGRSIIKGKFGHPDSVSTFLKATHVVTPCRFMTDSLLVDYSMAGTSTALIAETGYPRMDATVNADARAVSALRRRLGVEEVDGNTFHRPVVLYAPTWRTEAGHDTFDTELLHRDLDALARLDVQLMYRGHHRIDRIASDHDVGQTGSRAIVPPQDVNSNELLSVVDILITDYSSIFFDFLPTGLPIVHYLYDLDHYSRTRGLNLTADELPGAVARNSHELVAEVTATAARLHVAPSRAEVAGSLPIQGERYREAQQRFAPHEDGAASARAVEFLLRGAPPSVTVRRARDGRPAVAFWAGRLSESSRSDAFLLKAIGLARSEKYQVTVVIDRKAHISRSTMQSLRALKSKISVVPFDAAEVVLTQSEESAMTALASAGIASPKALWARIREDSTLVEVYTREYQRRLDDAHFDLLFLAPGLDRHEVALAGMACTRPFSYGSAARLDRTAASLIHGPKQRLVRRSARARRYAQRMYRAARRD